MTFDVDEAALAVVDGCAGAVAVSVVEGGVPDGARVIARYTVRSSSPVSMREHHAVLKSWAAKRCATDVYVVRAEVSEGATGVDAVVAVATIAAVTP